MSTKLLLCNVREFQVLHISKSMTLKNVACVNKNDLNSHILVRFWAYSRCILEVISNCEAALHVNLTFTEKLCRVEQTNAFKAKLMVFTSCHINPI